MRRLKKSILILFILSCIRLFNHCCQCDTTIINFDIETLSVYGLDNSGSYPVINTDTIHHNAIAFELWLSDADTTEWAYLPVGFGFEQALACDCAVNYKANQTIDSIQVINLGKFNENIVPGQEINEFCLAYPDAYYEPGKLYITLSELIEQLNNQVLGSTMIQKFQLFITEKSIYHTASFEFRVFLSDGKSYSQNVQIQLK